VDDPQSARTHSIIPPPKTLQRERHNGSVLFVRHGLTQWNTDQRWQGWADVELSPVGERQAVVAARNLRSLLVECDRDRLRVVCSDLSRARKTAEVFAGSLGVSVAESIPDLRERNVGDWSGLTVREIDRRWPGLRDSWHEGNVEQLPGGEHESEFQKRIFRALSTEAERSRTLGMTTILVSHGGVLRSLERELGLAQRPIPNVSGRWFWWNGETIEAGSEVDLLDYEIHEEGVRENGVREEGVRANQVQDREQQSESSAHNDFASNLATRFGSDDDAGQKTTNNRESEQRSTGASL
jgi:broad specificity phosphatase PhoE